MWLVALRARIHGDGAELRFSQFCVEPTA
eukprot:COSAG01_NODE_44848_length_415_cov_0.639241_1_plen_28_part_10